MPVLPDLNGVRGHVFRQAYSDGSCHIEQDCNAYDAEKSGAGIISSDFNLQQLLEFAKDYHPNRDFCVLGTWS